MKQILALSFLLLLAACGPAPLLQEEVVRVVLSPDRAHEVVVSVQDPGALGGRSTALHLRKAGEKSGTRFLVAMQAPKIEVRWSGPKVVEVALPPDADVRFEDLLVSGIQITRVPLVQPRDFMAEADGLLRSQTKAQPNAQHNAGTVRR